MELDPKFIWAPCAVHSCTHWLRTRNSTTPSPRIWAHIRGRYWSAKIDDISLFTFHHMRRLSFPSCEAIFHNFLGEESMLWRFLEASLVLVQGLKKT